METKLKELYDQRNELIIQLGHTIDPDTRADFMDQINDLTALIKNIEDQEASRVRNQQAQAETAARIRHQDAETESMADEKKWRKIGIFLEGAKIVVGAASQVVSAVVQGRFMLGSIVACCEETDRGGFVHNERIKVAQVVKPK